MLYLQAFVLVVLFGKLMRKLFFGQLRAAEMEVCTVFRKKALTYLYQFNYYYYEYRKWFIRKLIFLQHLVEMSWYAVTETCLAFTVFREDFSPRFVGLFTVLLFLKCFHWLAEDRVDFMERSPVISLLFHARAVSLMTLLAIMDMFFISNAYYR